VSLLVCVGLFTEDDVEMITIFGASGFIGSHLFAFYQSRNVDIVGTYFKNRKTGLVPYDINKQGDIVDVIGKNCKFAVITVNTGTIDYHKTHLQQCLKLNHAIKKLIEVLYENKTTPVFLSTDYVFEGLTGSYKEDDFPNPTTQYGKDKLEIENQIRRTGENYIIIRLGKVYGHLPSDGTLITNMARKLMSGQKVEAAVDQILSPTSVNDVVKGIAKCIEADARGIFHLSTPCSLSRYDIAMIVKSNLRGCQAEVVRCSINDFPFAERRPLNTTLNSDKTSEMFGLAYSSLESDISGIIRQFGQSIDKNVYY
jgi:dTDP-4-dehydrorhamnose reductase